MLGLPNPKTFLGIAALTASILFFAINCPTYSKWAWQLMFKIEPKA